MYRVHNANAARQSVFGAAGLEADEFNEARVAFILDAVIRNQEGIGAVLKQSRDEFPEMMGGQTFALEKVGDAIVTDLVLAFRQVRTGEVGNSANQKFDVLKFGNHSRILSCG